MIETEPPNRSLGRRERKRRETANHLAATAFRLFDALGYEAVTMERIAAEADVAKGTLYNYFPVKETILAHQFRGEIATGMASHQDALARLSGFAAKMRYLLRASAEWNRSRRAYLPHYLRFRVTVTNYGEGRPLREEYQSGTYRILEALFREAQSAGDIRRDLSPQHLAATFEFMLSGTVMRWLNQPSLDLAKNFELDLDLLLNGAAAPNPAARTGARTPAREAARRGKKQ